MKKVKTVIITLIMAMSVCINAWAASLQEAKQKGWVGEQPNGYLGAVVNTAEAKQIVKTVNGKRKAKYQELAKKNKITLDQVAQLAGQKAIKKTRPGHYIKTNAGAWVKK